MSADLWRDLPPQQVEKMGHAVEEIAECHRILAKSGLNLVGEVLRGFGEFFEFEHYPPDDAYDGETHAQYYFHAHPPEAGRPADYGHFHIFMRPKGMRADITPAKVADFQPPEQENDALCHLIAISMNREGLPTRLFTTNRWVTAEYWYEADSAIAMLDGTVFDIAFPSWPLNRWLSAMLVLFRPQIEMLIRQRDARVAEWQARFPERNCFEDRELEILSSLDISLTETIDAFASFWEERSPPISALH